MCQVLDIWRKGFQLCFRYIRPFLLVQLHSEYPPAVLQCQQGLCLISSFLLLCLNTMRNATLFIVFYRFLPLIQSKIPHKLFSPPGRKHNCIACPPHPDVPKMQFSWRNIITAIQAIRCIKRSLVYMCINHFWTNPGCGAGVLDGHFLTSFL